MVVQTKQLVTKDMTIGEVVNKYPETTSVMLSYGLHCVGCAVNPFETIENGCLGHGIDEKTIEKLVNDINKTIENKDKRIENVVSITQNAAKKFKEFMKEEKLEGYSIRLSIVDTGSTLQYNLDFADKPSENEEIFKGTEIDYVENERGSGFKIDNPNSHGGCGQGCGCSEK